MKIQKQKCYPQINWFSCKAECSCQTLCKVIYELDGVFWKSYDSFHRNQTPGNCAGTVNFGPVVIMSLLKKIDRILTSLLVLQIQKKPA